MKTVRKQSSKWTKKKIIFTLAIVIPVLATCYLLFYLLIQRPLEIRQNRQDFARAEAYINNQASEIQITNGEARSENNDNGCVYHSFGFEKGYRTCHYGKVLIFEVKSVNEAEVIANNTAVRIGTPLYKERSGKVSEIKFETINDSFSQSALKFNSISCFTSYALVDSNTLSIGLSCGGDSNIELYPVID